MVRGRVAAPPRLPRGYSAEARQSETGFDGSRGVSVGCVDAVATIKTAPQARPRPRRFETTPQTVRDRAPRTIRSRGDDGGGATAPADNPRGTPRRRRDRPHGRSTSHPAAGPRPAPRTIHVAPAARPRLVPTTRGIPPRPTSAPPRTLAGRKRACRSPARPRPPSCGYTWLSTAARRCRA